MNADFAATPIRRIASGGGVFTDGDWIETPFITDIGVRLIQTGNVGIGKFREQGYRYISDASFLALNCTEVRPGDLLISRLADPVGRCCIAPELGARMITSVDVAILRPRPGVADNRYLNYYMSSSAYLDTIAAISRGGTRERISRDQLGAVDVLVPPLVLQRAIADYLDRETARIDALIAAKRRLAELLEEKRSELATHVLLGPPVAGSSAGPGQVTLRPGWSLVPFRRLFREIDIRSATGSETLLSVSQTRGVIPQSELGDRRQHAETLVGYKLCNPGDFVVNRMWVYYGALGAAKQRGIVSPDYAVFRPMSGMSSAFAAYVLRTPAYVGEMTRLVRGIGAAFQGSVRKPRLHPNELGLIEMPTPPHSAQQTLLRTLDEQTKEISHRVSLIGRSRTLLEERRQTLITAAVTGQLDIPEAA